MHCSLHVNDTHMMESYIYIYTHTRWRLSDWLVSSLFFFFKFVKKYSLYLCFAFYKLGQRLFFKKQLGQRFKKQQALIIRTILLIIIQLNANKKTSLWWTSTYERSHTCNSFGFCYHLCSITLLVFFKIFIELF